MEDVYAYIDVPGEGLKKVLVVSDLSDISDIGSLEDVYVTTTEGKRALAIVSLGSVGIPDPARLISYLPVATPYTTPVLAAETPTKILVPTTAKSSKEFTLDIPNNRYFFNAPGRSNVLFEVQFTTSITTSSSNHLVALELYVNGVFEEGVSIERFVSGGGDKGALAIIGGVFLSDTDYIEIYVTDSTGGTVTFDRLAITIREVVGAV